MQGELAAFFWKFLVFSPFFFFLIFVPCSAFFVWNFCFIFLGGGQMQGPCLTEARIWASLLVRYTDCTVHMYVVFVGFTGVVRDEWYSTVY